MTALQVRYAATAAHCQYTCAATDKVMHVDGWRRYAQTTVVTKDEASEFDSKHHIEQAIVAEMKHVRY